MRTAKFPVVALLVLVCATKVAVAADDKAKIANIESAATEIAQIQKDKGSDAGYTAVRECYDREFPGAKTLSPKLERCMTQDIILSNAASALSSQLDVQTREKTGQGDPEAVTRAMVERLAQIFTRFNVSEEDGVAFNRLVNERGTLAYARTMFPGDVPAKNPAPAKNQPPAKKK